MLKMLDSCDYGIIEKLSADSILGARICCYARCYGFDKNFADFWAGEGALIARFENTFTVKADPKADFEELREFIDVLGAVEIITEAHTAIALGFSEVQIKNGYKYIGDEYFSDEVSVVDDCCIPELYDIISVAIPDSFSRDRNSYLSFLSDYMYRRNRGYSRAYGVFTEGKLVSTAITSAETDFSAVISGVACVEEYRKCGYSKKTVLTLASLLKNENKNVYVIALNESAEGFYKHIGFVECEKIAYISEKV